MIARIASRQRGVVSRAQLLTAGLSRHEIEHRLRSGALHVLHRGVYAVGHLALHPHAHLVAALLATGRGSAVSHRSSAEHWAMLSPGGGPIHVTRPASRPTTRRGIVLHRVALPLSDLRRHDGLPVTSPERTLLDLAATEPDPLPEALNEALMLGLVRPHSVTVPKGHRGARVLQDALATDHGYTRSQAERELLGIVRRAKLPPPRTNVLLGRREVDALWPKHLLNVEVDGFAAHGRRRAFEDDRDRDGTHLAAGYRTLRFTWRQLTGTPERVAALLGAALAPAHDSP